MTPAEHERARIAAWLRDGAPGIDLPPGSWWDVLLPLAAAIDSGDYASASTNELADLIDAVFEADR